MNAVGPPKMPTQQKALGKRPTTWVRLKNTVCQWGSNFEAAFNRFMVKYNVRSFS